MHVIAGALTVKLPGSDSWEDFTGGSQFTVPANSKFQPKVTRTPPTSANIAESVALIKKPALAGFFIACRTLPWAASLLNCNSASRAYSGLLATSSAWVPMASNVP